MDIRSFGLSDEDLRQLGYKVGEGPEEPRRPGSPGEAPRGRPDPRRRASPALRIWIATVLVLPLVAWGASLSRKLPEAAAAATENRSFSSARALAQLVELAQQPHPTGSPDIIRVRSVLLGRLNALGLQPELQVATAYERDADFVRAATVRNIVARIPGSASTGAVALIAHYDSAPLSPGAGDNALGVATLLEAVRALVAEGQLRNDLVLVLTDAGELSDLGYRAFREQHPWAQDVVLTVSAESRGTTGPALLVESLATNGAVVEALAAADVGHASSSLLRALRGSALEGGGSLESAEGAPLPEIALTVLGGRAWEDQSRDTRERVSERTLQHGGEQLLALVRSVGDFDLRRDLASPGRAYLTLPVVGLVHYPAGWTLFVSLGLLVLWGLTGGVIRLRRGTRRGVLAGVAVGLAVAVLSSLAASGLFQAVRDVHSEYGTLDTAFYHDGPYIVALALVALALASVAYALARRWCRIDEILFGALAVPLGLVLWLTFSAPDVAVAVQWPLGVSLVAALVVTVLGPLRGRTVWSWALILILSATTLALALPSLELLASTTTLRSASTLGAWFGLAALLLLPLMDWLQRPRFWALPLAALATSGILAGLYLPSVQGSVDHPEPTTLVYLADEPASPGPVLRGGDLPPDTSRTRTMLGQWLTVPGPGETWARSWVGEPPAGSTDPGVLLVGPDSLYEIAGSGPDSELAPPTLTVVESTPAGARRSLRVQLRSELRGEMVGLAVPEGGTAELTGVGTATWPAGGAPVTRLVHWGVPEGGTVDVDVSLPAEAQSFEVVVLEHHLRPRQVLGDYFFQRADSIIPNAGLGSDRVIQRTRSSVAVPAGPLSPLGGEEPTGSEEALQPPEQEVRQ